MIWPDCMQRHPKTNSLLSTACEGARPRRQLCERSAPACRCTEGARERGKAGAWPVVSGPGIATPFTTLRVWEVMRHLIRTTPRPGRTHLSLQGRDGWVLHGWGEGCMGPQQGSSAH